VSIIINDILVKKQNIISSAAGYDRFEIWTGSDNKTADKKTSSSGVIRNMEIAGKVIPLLFKFILYSVYYTV